MHDTAMRTTQLEVKEPSSPILRLHVGTLVSPTRVRIPDILLTILKPQPDVLIERPVLVVEVLSPKDDHMETRRRATDYFQMGVPAVWIVGPIARAGHWSTGDVWIQADRLEVPGTLIYADLPPMFARLDLTRKI
jgi:Uma2 family endonuclease